MNEGAQRLKQWRTEKGLSQMDAAQHLGLHVSEVSRLERGHGTSLRRAHLLHERLGIPMGAWLVRVEAEPVQGS